MTNISTFLTINQSKWPVQFSKDIYASSETVWNLISQPGNLENCHPFCKQHIVDKWPGDNSRDTIEYLNGWKFERKIVRWIDSVGYDLFIGRKGGKDSFVSWRIDPINDQKCSLSINVYMYKQQFAPIGFSWIVTLLYIRPLLRKYLFSVVNGFEYYLQTGKPVSKNHFGAHPWFSAKN